MRKVISVIVILIIFFVIIFFVFTDKSYKLTKKAEEFYRENKIEEANDLLNEALQMNKLNRRAIILKGKISKHIERKENINNAEELYNEALKDLKNKKYDEARVKLMRSLDLIKQYSAENKSDEIETLSDNIVNKMNELTTKLANDYIEEAKIRYKNGELLDAYELLESIEFHDANIEQLKSKIAFDIGERRYNNILGADFNVSELEIRDGIYWFSRVRKDSELYEKSMEYIKTLKKYLSK